ncbi:uncharacterized protein LOC119369176 [Jatropha curcas]|uniref:uncharacterized protein LOC119369176 n=1 Tax=Jatropha curcas TaxID=180498 RepID=UPI00189509D1|nr:uncharacterized protein LOC119369176 [Jatropha curcas]
MAKLRGISMESKILATVYHLKTINSVHNVLEKDSFTWEQRIKVALGFASLLEFMLAENPPYMPCLIRNIDVAHIMLDEDYKPVLIDCSMISDGILTDRIHIVNQYLKGCRGCVDPVVAHRGTSFPSIAS